MTIPEKGFYRGNGGPFYNKDNPPAYYEVIGSGTAIEANGDNVEKDTMVIYRPLFCEILYNKGSRINFFLLPSKEWGHDVIRNKKEVARYEKITSPILIQELSEISRDMYGDCY